MKDTVTKLLVNLGQACTEYQDRTLINLNSKRIECDENWAYCYSEQKNVPSEHQGTFGYGDVWTWVAIDADTKLVPSWLVGERNLTDAYTFMADVRSRLKGRIQLTTDGLNLHLTVVDALMRTTPITRFSTSSTAGPPRISADTHRPFALASKAEWSWVTPTPTR